MTAFRSIWGFMGETGAGRGHFRPSANSNRRPAAKSHGPVAFQAPAQHGVPTYGMKSRSARPKAPASGLTRNSRMFGFAAGRRLLPGSYPMTSHHVGWCSE